MSEEILKWNHHNRNMLQNMYCLYINQEMIDVTLIMRNGEIKAHKLILCAGSRYFQHIILTSEEMKNRGCVVHCSISKEIMHYLLEFMYKGRVSVPNGDLEEVLDAAAFYQVRGVRLSENMAMSSCCSSIENLGSRTVCNGINERNETASSNDNLSLPREIHILSGSLTCYPEINRHRPNMKMNPIAVKREKITSVERLKKNDWGPNIEDSISETELSPIRCLKSSEYSEHANLYDEECNDLHGPRTRGKIGVSDDSEDSDDTRIESSPKPCTSLQATRSEISRRHSCGEVECIPNTKEAIELSSDSLEEDQSDNVNLENVPMDLTFPIGQQPIVATRNENSLHASKSSEYEEILLKSPLNEVHHLCVVCLEPFDDIKLHIKLMHKRRTWLYKQCEICGKKFSVHSFANPGHHTCEK